MKWSLSYIEASVVSRWKSSKIGLRFLKGHHVDLPFGEETIYQSKGAWDLSSLVNNWLSTLEEVIVISWSWVFINPDCFSTCHCRVDIKAISESNLHIVLVTQGAQHIEDLKYFFLGNALFLILIGELPKAGDDAVKGDLWLVNKEWGSLFQVLRELEPHHDFL